MMKKKKDASQIASTMQTVTIDHGEMEKERRERVLDLLKWKERRKELLIRQLQLLLLSVVKR